MNPSSSSARPSAPADSGAALDAAIAALEQTHAAALQRIRVAAAADERRRIASIRALGLPGQERLVQLCVDAPACTPEFAAVVLIKASRGEIELRDALARIEKGLDRLDSLGATAPS